ncbi:MAG: acetolactate synthase small subunit [Anaerolineae bacterium CG2_30_64_16]|nr:MAG: acetolactate synthase small subunit [Anaerolineae bacterium CG2_30_64_16]
MALVDRSSDGKETTRVLVALVENKPGVLTRVASLFRRRNFNIESLTVGHTDSPDISRMTIVVDATKTNAAMVERNLYKMVNIIDVQDVTQSPAVMRDLALIKVKIDGQTRFEVMQLIDVYRAKVVDICSDSMIVEVTGPEAKVNSLVDMLRPYGIIEMVRTGLVAMVRGSGYWSGMPPENGNGSPVETEPDIVSLGM